MGLAHRTASGYVVSTGSSCWAVFRKLTKKAGSFEISFQHVGASLTGITIHLAPTLWVLRNQKGHLTSVRLEYGTLADSARWETRGAHASKPHARVIGTVGEIEARRWQYSLEEESDDTRERTP
ncbi:hypothetical protein C8F04DRAFT_1243325 [Mycena alexandri]|uniref:Uncharacterized protein n=1 Tax=Mycena alexandri TaxID=1745969 RepID=A0AAD6RZM3_9AGAR|nr:hypothetical protein C8F04DRAFT_1243325 [Mycena alexandri]